MLTWTKPTWYRLQSRKAGRKKSHVTGEVLLSFSLSDPIHTSATPHQLQQRLLSMAASSPDLQPEGDDDDEHVREREDSFESDIDVDDRDEVDQTGSDSGDESSSGREELKKTETPEKRKRRLKLKKLKKKAKQHAYEFSGLSDLAGVLFIEINRVTDLPPERNSTSHPEEKHATSADKSISDSYFIRYGPFRRDITRQEDV